MIKEGTLQIALVSPFQISLSIPSRSCSWGFSHFTPSVHSFVDSFPFPSKPWKVILTPSVSIHQVGCLSTGQLAEPRAGHLVRAPIQVSFILSTSKLK